MMAMTQSEELFDQFCGENGIECHKIEEGDEKSPDYELKFGNLTVIAEVKEFARNDEEEVSDRLLEERGYGGVLSYTPGDRVRKKINSASPQIRKRTKGVYPGILVLFDRGMGAGHIDPYNIRVAMCGLEQVHIAVPQDPSESPYATGMSYGPKRKMTESANTSISAIAALYATGPDELKLSLYHNKYASVPLDPDALSKFGITQYILREHVQGETSGWEKIEP
jgi:hypothetical protein